MFRAALLVLALAGSKPPAMAPAPEPVPRAVLSAADRARHPLDEGRMRIHVSVEQEGEPPVATTLDVYVRGTSAALCVFRDGRQQGRKVLMVGERVWLLVPGTKNPIPMTSNQRLLGGASIADLARLDLAAEFDGFARAGVQTVDGVACHVLDLRARSRKAPYASGIVWVASRDGLARKLRLALPSGKAAKELHFVAYGREAGRPVLRRLEIDHLLRSERGMRTVMQFVVYEPRVLGEEFFDPARAKELP